MQGIDYDDRPPPRDDDDDDPREPDPEMVKQDRQRHRADMDEREGMIG